MTNNDHDHASGYPPELLKQHLTQASDLQQKAVELRAEWYRRMLGVAVAALAVLAGLGPEASSPVQRWWLASCWAMLGTGIVAGTAATYLQPRAAQLLAREYRLLLAQRIRSGEPLAGLDVLQGSPSRLLSASKGVMVCSLLLAVVCLVVYMVLRTLAG